MNRKSAIAAALVVCCSFTGSASADSLSTRAVTALGAVIAAQGDAALVQIRRELAESARDAMRPFLPAPAPEQMQQTQPAAKPVVQHYL